MSLTNPNESERVNALYSLNILDTLPEAEFDELVHLASEICGTPIALMSLVDTERQWFKSKKGLDVDETPRSQSFCAHAILDPVETMVVTDARKDKRFSDNPLVTGDPKIVFYAGVPLLTKEGHALGTLCVIDRETRNLSASQLGALKILAHQMLDRLELRNRLKLLQESNAALLESNMLIQKFARTAAHDIRNPLTSIQLNSEVIQRLSNGKDEKLSHLASRNVASCKQLVLLVNEILKYSSSPVSVLADNQVFQINGLIQRMAMLIDKPDNTVITLPSENPIINTSLVAVEQIFINLLTNAIRYNDKDEINIRVDFKEDEQYYRFKVTDNGIGIAAENLKRIFDDNFTIGALDRFHKKGTGVGLSTVKMLVGKLSGIIYAESVPGEGSVFTFTIRK